MSDSPPLHVWNDPDGDGHNCADCPSDSIWKCDEAAHSQSILPDVTPILGLTFETPTDLLSPEKKAALEKSLRDNQRVRRQGAAEAGRMPLP